MRGTGGRSGSELVKVEVEVVSELDPPLKSTLFGDEVHIVNPVRPAHVNALSHGQECNPDDALILGCSGRTNRHRHWKVTISRTFELSTSRRC